VGSFPSRSLYPLKREARLLAQMSAQRVWRRCKIAAGRGWGTFNTLIFGSSKDRYVKKNAMAIILILAQSLNLIQSSALSALKAAPLLCTPHSLIDTLCVPAFMLSMRTA
jgi:hypothetical protein